VKALILASGIGSRLSPLTDRIPKCLVRVSDRSILEMQLGMLRRAGITSVIVTTGPFEEAVRACIKEGFGDLDVALVRNERFASTNYIYSLFKCRHLIDDDFILLHGDLVFDELLLRRLLACPGSAVCVNKEIPSPPKDFKGLVLDGLVTKIGVDVEGEHAAFLAPLYKLAQADFRAWMDKIVEFVECGTTGVYAENAFNELHGTLGLKALCYDREYCREIDTLDDLAEVRRHYACLGGNAAPN
jgi:choline kinase